jgi:hypothetical protein
MRLALDQSMQKMEPNAKINNDVRDGGSCENFHSCRVKVYSYRCVMSDVLYRAWWRSKTKNDRRANRHVHALTTHVSVFGISVTLQVSSFSDSRLVEEVRIELIM